MCLPQAFNLCSLSRTPHPAWFSSLWGLPALAPQAPSEPPPRPQVLFRYALAIFKYNEEEIMRLQDSLEIYRYLRFFTKTICNSR